MKKFEDYRPGVMRIERNSEGHKNPFGRGKCSCGSLTKYGLHHEFKTDVAKITFDKAYFRHDIAHREQERAK